MSTAAKVGAFFVAVLILAGLMIWKIEGLKMGALHDNVGASIETWDRFHWYSTTGWIMWNSQLAALLGGTTVCIYDGHPAGPVRLVLQRLVGLAADQHLRL